MADGDTLATLESASRRRPTVRRLVCPFCAGEVELREAHMWCRSAEVCGWDGTLAELAVEGRP